MNADVRRQTLSASIFIPLFAGFLLLASEAANTQSAEGAVPNVREITHIAGDLYRARNGLHYTVYLVTSEGIILADPLSADFAGWLKAELERLYSVPVRYVLYSHHHFDHASGARVFSETATLVGHKNFPEALVRSIEGFPVQFILNDRNNNGGIDRDEAFGLAAERFDELDASRDDFLTAAEILADVLVPEVLYADQMSISLGGKTVELVFPGPNHTIDASVLLFPDERTMFGVDFVNVGRLALAFPGTGTLDEWINSLRRVEALDFDIVSPGHGNVGTRAEFIAYREYFEDLRTVVSSAVESGISLDVLLESDALSEYSGLPDYDPQRNRNVEAAYDLLASDSN